MSEKSDRILLGGIDEPPEFDSDPEEIDQRIAEAELASAIRDVLDNLTKDSFRYVWSVQAEVIKKQPLAKQIDFAEQILETVFDLYDYQFPEKVYIVTKQGVESVFKFMEFLEYDNTLFISEVWKFLDANPLKIDLEQYCTENAMKIIHEVEEQTEIHPQSELTQIFLRTYIKDDFIRWFIRQTQNSKFEIVEKIYEREELKNGGNQDQKGNS